MRGGAPSTRAHLPARSSPTNPSSIPHFEPPALELRAVLQRARGGPKTERLIGNEVWRTRDASPPHTVHAAPRGRSRKQVANRRLPSGSSSLGLPELKKTFTPPTSSIPLWDSQRSGFGSNAVAQSSPLPWLLELKFD